MWGMLELPSQHRETEGRWADVARGRVAVRMAAPDQLSHTGLRDTSPHTVLGWFSLSHGSRGRVPNLDLRFLY